jgi:hypothetical protein
MKYINKSAVREVWDRMYQVLMSTREVKCSPTQKRRKNLIFQYIYMPTSLADRPSGAYCNPLTLTFSLGETELAHSSVCGAGCSYLDWRYKGMMEAIGSDGMGVAWCQTVQLKPKRTEERSTFMIRDIKFD